MKAPLENCIPLNEITLCKELGYTTHDLMYLSYLLVPFGGLQDINLSPGETIIICPATGNFGGAAVQVAVALGARVTAMGRNTTEPTRLKAHILQSTPNANIHSNNHKRRISRHPRPPIPRSYRRGPGPLTPHCIRVNTSQERRRVSPPPRPRPPNGLRDSTDRKLESHGRQHHAEG